MNPLGFNINYRNRPAEILELGRTFLGTGMFHAIEVTYYEHMQDLDTCAYNTAIRSIVKMYQPQVVVHLPAFNLSEENSVLRGAILQEIDNGCRYCAELGGRAIVLHSGRVRSALHVPLVGTDGETPAPDAPFRRAWDLTVQLLRQACTIAGRCGITIHTENLDREHLTVRCAELNELIDQVACEGLDIVFDIGHSHAAGGDIVREVREAGGRLGHLHLHDNWGDVDAHLPIGEGNIAFGPFFEALRQIRYAGLFMLELNHANRENLQSSRERILASL
ncbi:MAG: sugar phosphate isomerase/epimerase [Clostridiaceae bacterium]|jgi:sugar phosphate isomerase/epimerase|nr:sugar phosphate isomerase/epimerase [Clostridiaceae bacterium]